MIFPKVELPSNRKFGLFFTFLFVAAAAYFFYFKKIYFAYAFIALALIVLIVTLIKSDALLPLNRLWMQFGLLLGMLASPIILGVIFFLIITPIAMLMRMRRRDKLKLKFYKKETYWVTRSELIKNESFKQQF